MIAFTLKKHGLLDESNKNLESKMLIAVYRLEKLNYELTKLCAALEQAEVQFIPLKGAVLRKYYPEPWMRTNCDIDVLVHEGDLQRVVFGYRRESQNSHDISMFTQGGVHIEHQAFRIDNYTRRALQQYPKFALILPRRNYPCYPLQDHNALQFYFYHIAHMAKHFVGTGGCGIRPFLDIWVLNHRVSFDREKRDNLLSEGGLSVFAKQAELLSEVWFGNAVHAEITKQMEEYIIRGSVYGTATNRVVVQQQKKGGKVKYAFSKIFIPYEIIKFHYPILQKHRWLTPIMEVRR